MPKTKIEWVQNPDGSQGYTWNPITGCLNHVNGLCKGGGFPCYAYRLANGRLKQRYLANPNTSTSQIINDSPINMMQKQVKAEVDPFYPRFWEERLDEIWGLARSKYDKARGIFLCDMSDLFGIGIPEEWTKSVLEAVKHASPHRFYLLTKQAARLPQFSPFPDNCWVGVTCTNQTMVLEATNHLYNHRIAKTQFLSIEPLLSWNTAHFSRPLTDNISKLDLDWLIIGAQTKPTKFPEISWVREIVNAADKAGIPVFLKDNLRGLLPKEPPFYTKCCAEVNGKDPCYEEPCLSEHLVDKCSKAPNFWQLRQELPSLRG